MLYTGKGDNGTSKLFTTPSGERLSKSDLVFETLGTLDELNSFLGLCRSASSDNHKTKSGKLFFDILHDIQKDLFIVQAEVGGSDMTMSLDKVNKMEEIIIEIETELPQITTFFIPGAAELSARFDVSRTVARRAERLVVAYQEKGGRVGVETLRYLNRLSSILYAFARLSNLLSGIPEESPSYK